MECFMILISIYGKIKPTIISKKLGLSLCNMDTDMFDIIYDEFDEELLIHRNKLRQYLYHGYDTKYLDGSYNLKRIVSELKWKKEGKSEQQVIAENLIEIKVTDFENSLLQNNNKYISSPTCEQRFEKKFLEFCWFVQPTDHVVGIMNYDIPNIIYDSHDYTRKTSLLSSVEDMMLLKKDTEKRRENSIKCLKYWGNELDNFLVEDRDWWLFDYIINAITQKSESVEYEIFKIMSLIELLIINPVKSGKTSGEMERKLISFIPKEIDRTKGIVFATIVRKLRNKIAHGDFVAIPKLLEEYRELFMQNYWFDEFEYSIKNWTYLNIHMQLNKVLAKILRLMITDKEKWIQIQKS
ncbi:MAG: hypothetical protein RR898_06980 [Clostridium sp.]